MNEPISHKALEHAYGPFDRDHDRCRHELLTAISRLNAAAGRTGGRKERRRVAGVVLSLAAVLLVGVTLSVTFWPPAASPAAAVERVRNRLLGVQSLHLKGWIFQTIEKDGKLTVERFPHQFYAERPCRYWQNAYGFSFEGNHTLKNVTHTYTTGDGEQAMWVSHDQRLARIAPAGRLESLLKTERSLQAKVFDRLVAGLPQTYRDVGTEETHGVVCQVYEQREEPRAGFGHRRRLWLDADNGAPVRMKAWIIRPSGVEEPVYEYDMIRINGPRPRGLFSFEAPAGYQVRQGEGEAQPLKLPDGAVAAGGGLSLGTWIPFNVDDRAVVLCWWVEVPIEDDGLQRTPRFALGPPGSKHSCRRIQLRNDARWNWSLLAPREEHARIGLDDRLSVVLMGDQSHLETVERPLRLPQEQLEQVLLEAQQSTISPGSDVEPFTLKDIKELIRAVPPTE